MMYCTVCVCVWMNVCNPLRLQYSPLRILAINSIFSGVNINILWQYAIHELLYMHKH